MCKPIWSYFSRSAMRREPVADTVSRARLSAIVRQGGVRVASLARTRVSSRPTNNPLHNSYMQRALTFSLVPGAEAGLGERHIHAVPHNTGRTGNKNSFSELKPHP